MVGFGGIDALFFIASCKTIWYNGIMNRDVLINFRVSDKELETIDAIAESMGRNRSDTLRFIIRVFAATLNLAPDDGAPVLNVKVERYGKLDY